MADITNKERVASVRHRTRSKRPAQRDEVRLLVVMYTDVGDSTGLNHTLGDERARARLRFHDELVRGELARFGGTERAHLGDGFKITFERATDALACAVMIQRGLARDNRHRSDRRLLVRIGLHQGSVLLEDGDAFGETAIIAQRTMSRAQPGEVLVSEAVRQGLSDDTGLVLVDRGLFRLKGLPAPLRLHELSWDDAAHWPARPASLGAAADMGPRSAFLGREKELDRLHRELNAARDGARFVLVAAEPGMGKTRLISEFLSSIAARKLAIASVRCFADLVEPFGPMLDCLRQLASMPSSNPTAASDAPIATLAPLLPDLVPGVTATQSAELQSAPQARLRLLDAIASLLLAWSRERPIVLFVDDLHWADAHTLDSLRYLSRRLIPEGGRTAHRMLVLVAARTADTVGGALEEWAIQLRRERLLAELTLSGLDRNNVRLLLTDLAGRDPGDELLDLVFRRTEGCPYFVEEVYRDLIEGSRVPASDPRWGRLLSAQEQRVPKPLRALLAERVARLDVAAVDALRVASLLGDAFSFERLQALTSADTVALTSAIDAALAAGILCEAEAPGRYRFRHALVREATADQLGPARKAAWHAAIAALLIREVNAPDHAIEIAEHLLLAGEHAPADQTARFVELAADRATQLFAFEEAVRFLRAALAVLTRAASCEPGYSARLECRLVLPLGQLGRLDEAAEYAESARRSFLRIGLADEADQPYLHMASVLMLHARHEAALRYLGVLQLDDATRLDATRARALEQYALALDITGTSDRMIEAADLLARYGKESGNSDLSERALLLSRNWHSNHTADLGPVVRISRRLVDLATRRGDAWDIVSRWADLGFFELVSGRVARALDALGNALEVAERTSVQAAVVNVRAVRALCFCYRGEWARVDEEWAKVAVHLEWLPGALRLGLLLWARSAADLWLGRPSLVPHDPQRFYSGNVPLQTNVLAATGLIFSERRGGEAVELLTAAARAHPANGIGVNWLPGTQAIAAGFCNLGLAAQAGAWYEALRRHHGTLLIGATDLILARTALLEGRLADAGVDLSHALRLVRRERLGPLLTLALLTRAELAAASAEPKATVQRLFDQARRMSATLGMSAYIDAAWLRIAERTQPMQPRTLP